MSRFIIALGFLLFFLILVFPIQFKFFKLAIMLVVFSSIFFSLFNRKDKIINSNLLVYLLIIITKGFIWTLIGFLNNNKGTLDVIFISFIWYIIYSVLIIGINSLKLFNKILKVLILATFFIVFIDLYFMLMAFQLVPIISFETIFNADEFYFSFYDGFLYLQTNHLNNLVFFFPLTIILLIQSFKSKSKFKFVFFVLVLLEFLLMLGSGRRIMWLTLCLTPAYILIFAFFVKISFKKHLVSFTKYYYLFLTFLFFIALNFIFSSIEIDKQDILIRFSNAFNSSEESTRFDQGKILLDNFYTSPLWGHGFAAEISYYKRSDSVPWAYELSYYDDLFKTGIIGFLFFLIFIGGIFYEGIKIIKNSGDYLMIGLLAALFSFLIANATNPFLSSFDYLWTLFLPIAYINVVKLNSITPKRYES